jgi:hypothetical protein
VGEFMKRNANQQVGIDVGRKSGAAVVGGGVIGTQQPLKLQLGIPDGNTGLPLDR